jgi:F0F1-type ATP synthase assembly protein I
VVLIYQAVIAAGAALVFLVLQGRLQALSALYGGLITLLMTLLLRRRVTKFTEAAAQGNAAGAAVGVMLRFLWVLLLFGLGFAVFKLDPLASIIGFGLAQLGYVIAMRKASH